MDDIAESGSDITWSVLDRAVVADLRSAVAVQSYLRIRSPVIHGALFCRYRSLVALGILMITILF